MFVRRRSRRTAGRQEKIRRRLGESPAPVTLNGPSIVTLSTSGIPTGVIGSIRSRRNGCSSSTVGAELFFRNATPSACGPAFTGMRSRKRVSSVVARRRRVQVVRLLVLRAAEAGEVDALAVERDLEIVRDFEAADDVDGLAVQPRLDDVLAIDREGVADQDAAARADRQALDVIVLRQVRPRRGTFRPSASPSYCPRPGRRPSRRPRDTAPSASARRPARRRCCRSRTRCRRRAEAMATSTSSASRSRMALPYSARFRRWRTVRPGIRMRGRERINRRLEIRGKPVERRLVRARHADRRHHAAAHLPNHFLPRFGARRRRRRRPSCRGPARAAFVRWL